MCLEILKIARLCSLYIFLNGKTRKTLLFFLGSVEEEDEDDKVKEKKGFRPLHFFYLDL